MIKICKIKKIAQPRTIEVTRLNGQAGTMLVIGLVLSMGGQELFAEILGDQAEAFAKEFIARTPTRFEEPPAQPLAVPTPQPEGVHDQIA